MEDRIGNKNDGGEGKEDGQRYAPFPVHDHPFTLPSLLIL